MGRLTYRTELGVSIDKNEDCPTMSICWACDIKAKDCNYLNDALEKLAEYEDLEEQGALIRLPSVYCVGGEVFPFVVTDFCLNKYETLFTIRYSGNIELYRNWSIRASLSDIGKRIFFTKEEAEAALERMKNGKVD